MSFDANTPNDPLSFMRNLWGNMGFSVPGMVAPTFDLEELDKRIQDLKTVEGWLRMNLSMLQMTIQGLEMQRTTVSTVKTMGKMAREAAENAVHQAEDMSKGFSSASQQAEPAKEASTESAAAAASALSEAALWPWQMMQQMREQMEQHVAKAAEAASTAPSDTAEEKPPTRKNSRSKKTD